MALTLKIIGGIEAGRINSFVFYSGEERTLTLQLWDIDANTSKPIPSGATKTLILHGTPDDITIANADISVNASDSSIFSTSLNEATTALMISGDIKFQYVDTGVTRIAILENGIKKQINSFE